MKRIWFEVNKGGYYDDMIHSNSINYPLTAHFDTCHQHVKTVNLQRSAKTETSETERQDYTQHSSGLLSSIIFSDKIIS